MRVKRTNIYLTAKQKRALELLSKETGLSSAELVRRAVDAYYLGEGQIPIIGSSRPRRAAGDSPVRRKP